MRKAAIRVKAILTAIRPVASGEPHALAAVSDPLVGTPIPAKTAIETPVIHVTQEQLAVLNVLAHDNPATVTQQTLCDLTGVSRNSIRTYLKQLMELLLVEQPRGPKKGYGLTAIGLDLLKL
jgi:RIO-like serine/threonine protein kinase